MKVQNDHLPANHQNIDNIPPESNQGEVDVDTLDLDQLGELYENALLHQEDATAAVVEIKKTIYDKQTVDSQRAGRYLSIKGARNIFPELTIEKARDLGLTKVEEKLDTKLVSKAYVNGVKLGKVEKKTFHMMRFIKEDQPE